MRLCPYGSIALLILILARAKKNYYENIDI